jgi:glycerol uptake facilitator-like aquaporin
MSVPIFLAEFIGTFILVLSILATGNPLFIAAAFLAAITIASKASGGHLNPAVSLVMLMNGSIKSTQFFVYVPAQVAGAITAYMAYKLLG